VTIRNKIRRAAEKPLPAFIRIRYVFVSSRIAAAIFRERAYDDSLTERARKRDFTPDNGSFVLFDLSNRYLLAALKGVLSGFDHLLDHLSADGTRLLSGKIAVVTLLEAYSDFRRRFHFEFIQSFLSFGNERLT